MLIPEDQIWLVVVGFIVAFLLAFGIGANDVANSFGTSVGSKVLTLKQACTLATICELLGAILLGAKVSNTIRSGIVRVDLFNTLDNGPKMLMAGQIASLAGSCLWMFIATFFRLPVSGTHSIVGATMGFSLVLFGFYSIHWTGVIKIVASWFISPLLSGVTSIVMFFLLRRLVLRKDFPLEPALKLLPIFYGTVVLVNAFSIFYDGPPMLYFHLIPLYGVFILSIGLGIITILCVKVLVVPHLRRTIMANISTCKLDEPVVKIHKNRMRITSLGKLCMPNKKNSDSSPISESQDDNFELVEDLQPNHEPISTGKMNECSNSDEENELDARRSSRVVIPRVVEVVDNTDKQLADGTKPDVLTIVAFSSRSNDNDLENEDELIHRAQSPTVAMISEGVIKDRPEEAKVFAFLQIITAVFGSFAHGGNDVSNAIGPLIGLWIIGVTQMINSSMPIPIWILAYGGLGISIGLWVWGRRVIQTLGEDLTQITPSTGVCIEIGSALTVLLASKIGLPISTTHCKVGSVVAVGRARSKTNVNWGIFRNILLAWLVTLPASGALSALIMYGLTFLV